MPPKKLEHSLDELDQDLNENAEDVNERGEPRQKHQRRHPAKRSADLARISALMMQGMSPDEVAIQLQLDRKVVAQELARLNKLWIRQIEEDAGSFRAILLHRAMELEAISMDSFQESKTKVVTDDTDSAKHGSSRSTKTYESAGDPAFLNSARECLKLQVQILGLDGAPQNVKVFDKDAFLDEVAKRIEEAKNKAVAIPVDAAEVREIEPAQGGSPFTGTGE
jgi:hypothetical protein